MSNQLGLRALNERLSGRYYIGSRTCISEAANLLRPRPKIFLVGPRPVLNYVRDPDTESVETLSVYDDEEEDILSLSQGPLEYRITGLTWYTPFFVNTCNLDSFLSAWVRKMRQTHGDYLKHVTVYDRVGTVLFQIANHALCAKEQVDSEFVKGMWLSAILPSTQETPHLPYLSGFPIDCRGCSTNSVFQHLENHSTFVIVSSCHCGIYYHTDFCFEIFNLQDIAKLGNPQRLHEANMPYCITCKQFRLLRELNPYASNWHLTFNYNSEKTSRDIQCPLLSEIPPIIEMKNIIFKLEYVSYSQETTHPTLKHEVSLQFIRNKWYLYDGGQTPKFRRWVDSRYDQHNSKIQTLVYFKI